MSEIPEATRCLCGFHPDCAGNVVYQSNSRIPSPMAQAKLGRVKQLLSAALLYWLTLPPRRFPRKIVQVLDCSGPRMSVSRSCAMTRYFRSVFSHSARLFLCHQLRAACSANFVPRAWHGSKTTLWSIARGARQDSFLTGCRLPPRSGARRQKQPRPIEWINRGVNGCAKPIRTNPRDRYCPGNDRVCPRSSSMRPGSI